MALRNSRFHGVLLIQGLGIIYVVFVPGVDSSCVRLNVDRRSSFAQAEAKFEFRPWGILMQV